MRANAASTDNGIVRGDGGAGRVQTSVLTIADTTGAISATGVELSLRPAKHFGVTIQQDLADDGTTPAEALTITGGSHLGVVASAEAVDVLFGIGRTVTWNTGALTAQRAIYIEAPTYAFDGASITDAATLYIAGAPAASTNATITSAWALWIECWQDAVGWLYVDAGTGGCRRRHCWVQPSGRWVLELEYLVSTLGLCFLDYLWPGRDQPDALMICLRPKQN